MAQNPVKLTRSTKCTLRFATPAKRDALRGVLSEYGRIVNHFIDLFWARSSTKKFEITKEVYNTARGLSANTRQMAAREALDLVLASRKLAHFLGKIAKKPTHAGKRMQGSAQIASLLPAKRAKSFDCWLHIKHIGGPILDLPIKLHRHFRALAAAGKRLNSYIITADYVQFAFEIQTDAKLPPDRCVGIDTGINALATASTGQQFGLDIKAQIERIKRCKHGSAGQRRASRALRQRMDETAKQVLRETGATLVVTEDLTGITLNTKRRLVKNMRRSIGRWNVRYWLGTLERLCEWNRVSFRRVSPKHTSQQCSVCGHVDRGNRKGSDFRCLACGFEANADVQASTNILNRFLTGPYGAGCKPLM